MRLTLILLLAVPCATGCAGTDAAPRPDKETQAELDKLQGVWKLDAVEGAHGKPELGVGKFHIAIKNGSLFVFEKESGDNRLIKRHSFAIDVRKSPKAIDLTTTDDDGKPRVTYATKSDGSGKREFVKSNDAAPSDLGIYKFNGEKLVLKFGSRRDNRPADFTGIDREVVLTFVKTKDPVPEFKGQRSTSVPTARK